MRILVAGATGAVGRHLVPALTAKGHDVIGTTRSPAKVGLIKAMGAQPAIADGLDGAVRNIVLASRPEVVVHQMTDLAAVTDLRHFDRSFAKTNALRTRGTDILLAAAREAGVKRFVAQSFCGWTFNRTGASTKDETEGFDPDPPEELRRTLEAIQYLERAVTASVFEPEGTVLRYGYFYGPGTGMFSPAMVDQLRRRRVPLIGDGGGWWSFIHVEDAAAATVAAIERGEPGSIYNIVDDHPAQVRDFLPALAGLLGARAPVHVPAWLGRLLAGEHMVMMMTQVRGGSNAKARRELFWQPAHSSWREGFAEVARETLAKSSAA